MIELLAPAGNLETLETALYFGADAVYMAGKQYGLRAFADNFTILRKTVLPLPQGLRMNTEKSCM